MSRHLRMWIGLRSGGNPRITLAAGSFIVSSGPIRASRRPHIAALPTGTVTFLFTDIEGPTRYSRASAAGVRKSCRNTIGASARIRRRERAGGRHSEGRVHTGP